MNSLLISAAIALFSGLIGFVAYMGVALMKHTKSTSHQTPSEREAVVKAVEEQIKAHSELDMERFRVIEKMLGEMREDIKTLLRRRK